MRRWVIFVLVGSIAWWGWNDWQNRHIPQLPGVLVPSSPEQKDLAEPADLEHKDYRITCLAEFDARARVLGIRRYYFDREAELAPIDFALGWGAMSDTAVLEHFTIRQGGRFYHWQTSTMPIPRTEIISSSANMHLIPADAEVLAQMKKARPGHVIQLKGYLVNVAGQDGWRWKSSLTRNDAGAGACEVVWVQDFRLMDSASSMGGGAGND